MWSIAEEVQAQEWVPDSTSANFVPFSASPPRRVWVRASFRRGSFPWCAWPAYLRNKILYNGNSKSEKDHEMTLLVGVRISVSVASREELEHLARAAPCTELSGRRSSFRTNLKARHGVS
jgi:hypothetical protein